uniref:Uncharacterized protein n=1 Tax=viral metagenome TaxID=1070528 RepID=A0A6C0CC69_9ZZZZ
MKDQIENIEFHLDAYLSDLHSQACKYEQTALILFDKAVACKPRNIKELFDFITDPNADIWAHSTKCVTYPKPLNVYMIGNGNGNADELVKEIMSAKQNEKMASYHKQLLMCTVRKDLNGIKALIKYGGDDFNINHQGEFGLTALHIAVANKSGTKMINYLIEHSSLEMKDDFGQTALYYAVRTMRFEIVDMLLQRMNSQQVNILDNRNMSPLCFLFDQVQCEKMDDEFLKIENALVKSGAKYIALRPFVDAFDKKFAEHFVTTKSKIHDSIEQELKIVATENVSLRNDIIDIVIENDNLKKMVEDLHKNIDDIVDTHQKQITEMTKSQLSINDCMKTISIQEEMIKNLTDKINKLQANAIVSVGRSAEYYAYPFVDNRAIFGANNGYASDRGMQNVGYGLMKRGMEDVGYDRMSENRFKKPMTEFICHLSGSGKKN